MNYGRFPKPRQDWQASVTGRLMVVPRFERIPSVMRSRTGISGCRESCLAVMASSTVTART